MWTENARPRINGALPLADGTSDGVADLAALDDRADLNAMTLDASLTAYANFTGLTRVPLKALEVDRAH